MTAPLGRVERLDNGNVVLTLGGTRAEFTPENIDVLVLALLRKAHPREHMFVIPVPGAASGVAE